MAISLAGGTDKVRYSQIWPGSGAASIGCIAFRMKTAASYSSANVIPLSIWDNTSRRGIGFVVNSTANKVTTWCYDVFSPPKVDMVSTTSVNDGNWHSIALNFNGNSGGANTLFVDGAQNTTTNATAAWSILSSTIPMSIGENNDSFWPTNFGSFVGQVADVAFWEGRNLTADEQAAYGKGFSPKLIAPDKLEFYAPMVRTTSEVMTALSASVTGTSVADHPRVLG